MAANRIARVNEVLRRELAALIAKLRFPAPVLVTVTDVDTAPDIKSARVYLSFLGGSPDDQRACRKVIISSRAELQHEVSRRVTMKYTPQLRFETDQTAEYGTRMVRLLDEIEAEDAARPQPPEAA